LGHLKIAVLPSLLQPYLQQALLDFTQHYPDVQLSLSLGGVSALYRDLMDDRVDLILVDGVLACADVNIARTVLATETLYCISRYATLRQLKHHAAQLCCIRSETPASSDAFFDQWLTRQQIQYQRTWRIDSEVLAIALLQQQDAMMVLAQRQLHLLASTSLQKIALKSLTPYRIILLWKKQNLSPLLQHLLDFVVSHQ
jgi:DNA-binding transcriptional LysR family regulator